jgi:hypothetical protein
VALPRRHVNFPTSNNGYQSGHGGMEIHYHSSLKLVVKFDCSREIVEHAAKTGSKEQKQKKRSPGSDCSWSLVRIKFFPLTVTVTRRLDVIRSYWRLNYDKC